MRETHMSKNTKLRALGTTKDPRRAEVMGSQSRSSAIANAQPESEIERIGRELGKYMWLLGKSEEMTEVASHLPDPSDEIVTAWDTAIVALSFAERKVHALRALIATEVPRTLREIQILHIVQREVADVVSKCRNATDHHHELLEDLNERIAYGLRKVTGNASVDYGLAGYPGDDELQFPEFSEYQSAIGLLSAAQTAK